MGGEWGNAQGTGGFHHQSAQRIAGTTAERGVGREWEYPLVVEAMETVGIHSIWVHIRRRKSTIAEKVVCLTIYELCANRY